jgi:hypothetical protein
MKKEEIYVVIDSEEKKLRAISILENAGEKISKFTESMYFTETFKNLRLGQDGEWYVFGSIFEAKEITLDQLEQLLNPKQEVKMELDALKLIAESYGFELVEKKREIKVGDFGKFSSEIKIYSTFGFLREIDEYGGFVEEVKGICNTWAKFRHLTEAEKAQITKNW